MKTIIHFVATLFAAACLALCSSTLAGATSIQAEQALGFSRAELDEWGVTKRDVQHFKDAARESRRNGVNLTELKAELDSSELDREYTDDLVTYTLGHGVEITLAADGHELAPSDAEANPALSGGTWSGGFYVKFNNTDQKAIISGATLLLGAAICAIPAVGWVACTAVGLILVIANTYLTERGICTNNRQLRIDMNWAGDPQRQYCTT